jgi:hypothetical protein
MWRPTTEAVQKTYKLFNGGGGAKAVTSVSIKQYGSSAQVALALNEIRTEVSVESLHKEEENKHKMRGEEQENERRKEREM